MSRAGKLWSKGSRCERGTVGETIIRLRRCSKTQSTSVLTPENSTLLHQVWVQETHTAGRCVSHVHTKLQGVSNTHCPVALYSTALERKKEVSRESFSASHTFKEGKNSARQEKLKYLFQWVRHRQTYVRLSSLSQLCSVKVISGLLFLWFTQSEEIICPSFCTVPWYKNNFYPTSTVHTDLVKTRGSIPSSKKKKRSEDQKWRFELFLHWYHFSKKYKK